MRNDSIFAPTPLVGGYGPERAFQHNVQRYCFCSNWQSYRVCVRPFGRQVGVFSDMNKYREEAKLALHYVNNEYKSHLIFLT
ncbi:MAG: hypothetical protein K0Q43_3279 [Ramlibacter sp.]|jgi:hypothetical protein|nr:hypothetical protein [Ramlibacter sp.]